MMSKLLPIGIAIIIIGALAALFNNAQTPYPTYILITGIALVAVYVLTNLREMAKRSTMYGVNAVLMSVFMIAILVVIYLIAQNRDKTWDFSSTGKYTLDNQTASILDNLQTDVKILLFYPTIQRASADFEQMKTLLDQYVSRSPKISYTLMDVSNDYDTAVKYQALLNSPMEPTIIAEIDVDGSPFREKAKGVKQEDISNAIKKVTHREAATAYFLTGHYEKELNSEGPTGLAAFKQFLEEENIQPNPLRLPASGEIPKDANIIAIIGPEEDFTETEIASLRRFVLSGGSLLLAIDPESCPKLADAMQEFGVDVGQNLIIEMEVGAASLDDLLRGKMTARPSDTVSVSKFTETHEITKDLGKSTVSFIKARGVSAGKSPAKGILATSLAESSAGKLQKTSLPNSWAESDPKSLSSETASVENIFDSKTDKEGPISMAVACELDLAQVPDGKPDPAKANHKSKVIVLGDSDFLTNGGMAGKRGGGISRGHLDFALNMFNWLTGQVDLITIRQKEADNTSITLTQEDKSFVRNLLLIAIPVFFIPLIGIGVGLYRRMKYV